MPPRPFARLQFLVTYDGCDREQDIFDVTFRSAAEAFCFTQLQAMVAVAQVAGTDIACVVKVSTAFCCDDKDARPVWQRKQPTMVFGEWYDEWVANQD